MKSYKCAQCGLTNWTTVESCKRCQSPNPYLDGSSVLQTAQTFSQTSSFSHEQKSPSTFADFQSPPPPSVYGNRVGNNSQIPQKQDANRTPRTETAPSRPFRRALPPEAAEKLQKSEKDVYNAWRAGRAWSLFVGGIVLLAIFLVFLIAKKPGDTFGFFLILFMIVLAGGMFALSYGVKRKSRACVIILLSITSLGLLANIVTILTTGKVQNIVSVLFSILLTYYFALGAQGIFSYYQLKAQYPDLIE